MAVVIDILLLPQSVCECAYLELLLYCVVSTVYHFHYVCDLTVFPSVFEAQVLDAHHAFGSIVTAQ